MGNVSMYLLFYTLFLSRQKNVRTTGSFVLIEQGGSSLEL